MSKKKSRLVATIVMLVYWTPDGNYCVQMGDDGTPMPLVTVTHKDMKVAIKLAIEGWKEAEGIG